MVTSQHEAAQQQHTAHQQKLQQSQRQAEEQQRALRGCEDHVSELEAGLRAAVSEAVQASHGEADRLGQGLGEARQLLQRAQEAVQELRLRQEAQQSDLERAGKEQAELHRSEQDTTARVDVLESGVGRLQQAVAAGSLQQEQATTRWDRVAEQVAAATAAAEANRQTGGALKEAVETMRAANERSRCDRQKQLDQVHVGM